MYQEPAYQAPEPAYQPPEPVYQAPAYQAPEPAYQAPVYQEPEPYYGGRGGVRDLATEDRYWEQEYARGGLIHLLRRQ